MQISKLIAIGLRFCQLLWNQWRFNRFHSLIGWFLVSLLTLLLTTSLIPVAIAQNSPDPSTSISSSTSLGNLVYVPLKLDGRQLFQVTAEAASEQISESSESPLEIRVNMYESTLYQILDTGFDPDTLSVTVANIEEETVILANDRDRLSEQLIMKVSALDARIHGISRSDLAEQFAQIIQSALIQARAERQSDYLLRQGLISAGIILSAIASSLLLVHWQKRAIAQWQQLQEEPAVDALKQDPKETGEVDRSELLDSVQKAIDIQQKRNVNTFKRLLLQIGHLTIWLGGIAWILGQFPWTRSFQIWVVAKLMVLIILVTTNFAIKGSNILIDRFLIRWQERQDQNGAVSQRRTLRISTFSQVLKGIITFAIASVGILLALHKLHIPLGPILAGAGIFGFAISFGSQTLVRDVINGTLILLEDQYAIGDFIFIGDAGGQVESMNLRITQIRSGSGDLITVPNSAISTVRNVSKEWSRINFEIEVAYDTDVTQVMQIMQEVAEEIDTDPEWGDRIIEPVNLLGINGISHSGIRMLIWIKTQPAQQWSVAREYRKRLKLAFDRSNIQIGMPQEKLWWQNHLPDAKKL